MKNKIFIGIFLIVILISNISFANYSTVTMEVVEEPVCTIQIGENSKFEKRLISKDLKNKEVTLQLKVTNEEIANKPTGELILVLDDSNSMNDAVGTKTRKDLIFTSAKTLVSSLLENNTNLNIGIVKFSTVNDATQEGTLSDASVVSALSNDATALNNAIDNIQATGPRTNLQSGLVLASQQFSQNATNKYMIVLTDGVPNVSLDFNKYYYSQDVIDKTKSQLTTLEQNGITLITMLTGVDENDHPTVLDDPTNPDDDPNNPMTYGEFVETIFGSSEAPTAGDFYYVTDDEIEKTIENDIYNSLLPIEKSLTNIEVVDYFPAEIVKNFDFAYVSKANIGDISASIDTTNNSITWTIPELASGETATVQYKLKLKENFDSSIVGKILDTNEKESITYTNFEGEEQSETSEITPKLKLSEPPAVLPQTGTIAMIGLGVLSVGLVIFSTIKLVDIYKKMN